ncbi:NADPH-dependent F420 reductase [Kutzneria kofuensis]|uniref:Pyrroline-5-carboxylate reductase catalytic N-terminal domain-containing protein n=1 Tax=Kutzneria kofuensis TaxID=103725 RepID=A0A7W9KEG5_9PSEU|nr:NADPH-dependent F420 reductase [Kutzneria kofuensis]MBB5890965.1 hypothetical protein [Kutzneria kofuensis]
MSKSTTVGRLAVIGTGKIGQAAGKLWLHAGYEVVFGSRNPAGPAAALADLGATVATPLEAARAAEVVLLAVPGETVEELLPELADALAGKMVIDATNKIAYADGRWVSTLEPGLTEGRWMAQQLPRSTVVRAFSHIPDELLWPRGTEQALYWAMAIAGDDVEAKATLAGLIRDAGWVPVDVGTLDESGHLDPGGSVFHLFYTETEMREVVGLTVAA